MAALLAAEVSPLRVGPQRLVGEPDRPPNLVRVGVDAISPRRRMVVSPRRVLLRQREVLPGVGPVLSEKLRRCALMSVGEDPGELGRLAEDRVRREHEASEVGRDVRIGWRARVVVAVQESLVVHAQIDLLWWRDGCPWPVMRRAYLAGNVLSVPLGGEEIAPVPGRLP